jgi:RNA polymerase sigma factor (sigma-70 family)
VADIEWAMSSISPAAARIPTDGRSLRLSRLGDELLARQATRGSGRAFTALYERYYQALYRYCRSIVRDDADAQDALQSTFTSALAALQRDARNAPLRPWLYRIAHNESISLLRRRKRDGQHEAVTEEAVVGVSAEEEAAGRARWQRVVEDLAELPERQRGSLLLRELAGLSHEEIALTFGTTVGAAKQAIFEARQGLAELEEGRALSCAEIRSRISEGDRRLLRARRVNAHLRDCAACAAFAVAIPARQADLRALTPVLPPAVAGTLLGRVIGSGGTHAGAGSAAGAAAVGKTAGTVVGWKALATVGVIAVGAAGVTGLTHALHHARVHLVHPAVPAAVVKSARPLPNHGASAGAAASRRSPAGHHAAAGGHSANHSSHHGSAAANSRAKHPHGAAHSRAVRRHGSAHSGSASSVSLPAATTAPNSNASSRSHGASAPGRVKNHGVRRHGSASGQTHRTRPTHTQASTRKSTASSPSVTVHRDHTTSTPSKVGGSATGVVKTATHASPTASGPVTVATPHPAAGSSKN